MFFVLTTTCHLGTKLWLKFTSKINNILKNKGSKETEKPASVSSLPPPISAKLPREVKDIMKYFKKNDNPKSKEITRKSYA